MADSVAQQYINLLEGDETAKLALLACSAALRLDDEIGLQVIELVAQTNGFTPELLRRIKRLGCVWKKWDGSWYIAEDVRSYLVERLNEEVPESVQSKLRELLAGHAHRRISLFSPDGQISTYRVRQAKFEAAFQRILIPEQSQLGAEQFAEIWLESPHSAAEATAQSVDYLAPEISRHLRNLPIEVLFLQGMAARIRRDKRAQEKYFGAVWERGNAGRVSAIAAHLYGLLVSNRDRSTAERALRDSIQWQDSTNHQVQVLHSLGNLLSKDRRRWDDAEQAYKMSLELDSYPPSRGETLHSLGNLLSKDRRRWDDAEQAYKMSLELKTDPSHKAQVLASWASLLVKYNDPVSFNRAEQFASQSLTLDPENPWTGGICHRVLADVFESRGDFDKAIKQLEALMKTDRQLGKKGFEKKIRERIERMKT
jgi:tetratricopeptide (TPR) repeat protein